MVDEKPKLRSNRSIEAIKVADVSAIPFEANTSIISDSEHLNNLFSPDMKQK